MNRLYVVVRNDLPPGLQLAQACHAARQFATDYHSSGPSENLVALSVPDELTLWRLADSVRRQAIVVSLFREPDLEGSLTAVAFDGAARPLVSSLPLALRARPGTIPVCTDSPLL